MDTIKYVKTAILYKLLYVLYPYTSTVYSTFYTLFFQYSFWSYTNITFSIASSEWKLVLKLSLKLNICNIVVTRDSNFNTIRIIVLLVIWFKDVKFRRIVLTANIHIDMKKHTKQVTRSHGNYLKEK